MNACVVTARAGSKSIEDKNVMTVAGKPLVAYPIQAALDASHIDKVYVSTDGDSIADVATELGCEVIWRPEHLRDDHVNHGDVIKQATEYIDEKETGLANIVVLLGNTVMVDRGLIDQSLQMLDERENVDSVMSIWEAADDHPLRALEIRDGLVASYGDAAREVSTERQSYPKAYYYDQGVWTYRKACVQQRDGPNPWWWMGKRCFPIVRTWATGRDIHTMFDAALSEWWVANQEHIQAEIRRQGEMGV